MPSGKIKKKSLILKCSHLKCKNPFFELIFAAYFIDKAGLHEANKKSEKRELVAASVIDPRLIANRLGKVNLMEKFHLLG
jgi:hypothetical protein